MVLLSCMAVSVLLSLCLVASAEASSTTWTQTYGGTNIDEADSVIQTSDGGYALAGQTNSFGAGGYDFWLLKTDAYGNIEWSKDYGGNEWDGVCSVVQTSDGGYALAGHTWSFGVGECDFLLIKTDAHGNMEWKNTYGGPELDVVHQMIATSDGGYALAGYTGTAGANSLDGWFVKTDEFGKMEWNQTYKWEEFDIASSVVETSDGGYAIAAKTKTSGTSNFDFWLIKTDEHGNMEWNQTYGDENHEQPNSLVATSDGGYVMAGYTVTKYEDEKIDVDFLVIKTYGNTETNQYDIYEYDYNFGYFTYTFVVSSNSTIEDFNFDMHQKQISFNVTGSNQTTGFCKIAIPKDLLDGDFPVYLNGEPMTEGKDYTKTYNGTHTIIQITYSHGTHLIEITGTYTIPECSTWTTPTILLAATLVIVIYKKKRST